MTRSAARSLALVATLVLALAASGCGDDDEERPAPAATEAAGEPEPGGETEDGGTGGEACELITAAEAEEAIGKPVELSDEGTNSTFGVCNYRSGAGDNAILTVGFGTGSAAYDSAVSALPDTKPAAGVGDQAVFVATGAGAAAQSGTVYAIAGEDYFTLAYSGEEDPEAVTTELAAIAADRLASS
jgi:hypothetical protein